MPHKPHFIPLLILSLILLNACSAGMNAEVALQADSDRRNFENWSRLEGAEPVTILGELIQSTELEALVDESLAANPGLQQTLLTLQIRRAEYRRAGGERLPEIEAGYGVGREKDSDTSYSSSLVVSWELDLWRSLSDAAQAAAKDADQQQSLYQSARDTLAAEVMKGWLGLANAQKSIRIERQRLTVLEKNESFLYQRYRNGLGTLEDLDSARSSTSVSRATLAQYEEELARQRRSLKTLLGRSGGDGILIPDQYAAVLIPLSQLPEQTLRRRPDLKAAFLAIQAADLRTKVAYKALLPSINLQAALADAASSPEAALFTHPVWSLLAQLTAPIYRGGRLRSAAEIASLESARQYQVYRETLLTAVQEIEDAVGRERALTAQLDHIQAALTASQNSLTQYQRSYRNGLVEILDLLIVQRQTYDLEIQKNNLIYDRLANRIDLGLALGLGVTP